jgi:hypothetical protein
VHNTATGMKRHVASPATLQGMARNGQAAARSNNRQGCQITTHASQRVPLTGDHKPDPQSINAMLARGWPGSAQAGKPHRFNTSLSTRTFGCQTAAALVTAGAMALSKAAVIGQIELAGCRDDVLLFLWASRRWSFLAGPAQTTVVAVWRYFHAQIFKF